MLVPMLNQLRQVQRVIHKDLSIDLCDVFVVGVRGDTFNRFTLKIIFIFKKKKDNYNKKKLKYIAHNTYVYLFILLKGKHQYANNFIAQYNIQCDIKTLNCFFFIYIYFVMKINSRIILQILLFITNDLTLYCLNLNFQ